MLSMQQPAYPKSEALISNCVLLHLLMRSQRQPTETWRDALELLIVPGDDLRGHRYLPLEQQLILVATQ